MLPASAFAFRENRTDAVPAPGGGHWDRDNYPGLKELPARPHLLKDAIDPTCQVEILCRAIPALAPELLNALDDTEPRVSIPPNLLTMLHEKGDASLPAALSRATLHPTIVDFAATVADSGKYNPLELRMAFRRLARRLSSRKDFVSLRRLIETVDCGLSNSDFANASGFASIDTLPLMPDFVNTFRFKSKSRKVDVAVVEARPDLPWSLPSLALNRNFHPRLFGLVFYSLLHKMKRDSEPTQAEARQVTWTLAGRENCTPGVVGSWWTDASMSAKMTAALVREFPLCPWDVFHVQCCPDLTLTDMTSPDAAAAFRNYPWFWRVACRSMTTSIAEVKARPDIPWDYESLAENGSVTASWEDVCEVQLAYANSAAAGWLSKQSHARTPTWRDFRIAFSKNAFFRTNDIMDLFPVGPDPQRKGLNDLRSVMTRLLRDPDFNVSTITDTPHLPWQNHLVPLLYRTDITPAVLRSLPARCLSPRAMALLSFARPELVPLSLVLQSPHATWNYTGISRHRDLDSVFLKGIPLSAAKLLDWNYLGQRPSIARSLIHVGLSRMWPFLPEAFLSTTPVFSSARRILLAATPKGLFRTMAPNAYSDFLSRNPNLTLAVVMEVVQFKPDFPWNWLSLSQNPGISADHIFDTPQFPWDYNSVVQNPTFRAHHALRYSARMLSHGTNLWHALTGLAAAADKRRRGAVVFGRTMLVRMLVARSRWRFLQVRITAMVRKKDVIDEVQLLPGLGTAFFRTIREIQTQLPKDVVWGDAEVAAQNGNPVSFLRSIQTRNRKRALCSPKRSKENKVRLSPKKRNCVRPESGSLPDSMTTPPLSPPLATSRRWFVDPGVCMICGVVDRPASNRSSRSKFVAAGIIIMDVEGPTSITQNFDAALSAFIECLFPMGSGLRFALESTHESLETRVPTAIFLSWNEKHVPLQDVLHTANSRNDAQWLLRRRDVYVSPISALSLPGPEASLVPHHCHVDDPACLDDFSAVVLILPEKGEHSEKKNAMQAVASRKGSETHAVQNIALHADEISKLSPGGKEAAAILSDFVSGHFPGKPESLFGGH